MGREILMKSPNLEEGFKVAAQGIPYAAFAIEDNLYIRLSAGSFGDAFLTVRVKNKDGELISGFDVTNYHHEKYPDGVCPLLKEEKMKISWQKISELVNKINKRNGWELDKR